MEIFIPLDVLDRRVIQLNQASEQLEIDLRQNPPAGLYILEMRDQKSFGQIRFMKE